MKLTETKSCPRGDPIVGGGLHKEFTAKVAWIHADKEIAKNQGAENENYPGSTLANPEKK